MRNNNFAANIYKLYVLCLPFGMVFKIPFDDYLTNMIGGFSNLVMLVGCFALMLKGKPLINQRNKIFGGLYIYMAISSIVMAIVLSMFVDSKYESPLSAISGDIVFYFLTILSVFYNSYCLSHYVSFSSIYKIFDWQIVVLLIVGYAQLLGMMGMAGPYNLLSSFLALKDISWLTDLNRGVTFFGSEPASAAGLCFVVFPYIYSSVQNNKGAKKLLYIIALLLFLVLVLGSNSSQFLTMAIGSALLFVWSCFGKIKKAFYYISFSLGLLFAIAYISSENLSTAANADSDSFEYVVFGKVVDKTNKSTAMRASTVINDLKVFADFPLTGVGDGNQGYFYAENQPMWTRYSGEVMDLITKNVVPNGGGNFFPAYISAYGIIGIFVLIGFIGKYRKLYNSSFLQKDKRMDTIFQISIILFLFASWHVVGIKQSQTMIFVLSLPCVKWVKSQNRTKICG